MQQLNITIMICQSVPTSLDVQHRLWFYDDLGLDSSKLRDKLGFPWHSDPDTEILSLDDSIATFLIGIGSEVESCLSTILTLPSSLFPSSSWKLGSWPGRGETPPFGPLHRFRVPSLPRWSGFPNSCWTCDQKFSIIITVISLLATRDQL